MLPEAGSCDCELTVSVLVGVVALVVGLLFEMVLEAVSSLEVLETVTLGRTVVAEEVSVMLFVEITVTVP